MAKDVTRDEKQEEKLFRQTALYLFVTLKTPMFSNKEEAVQFIEAYDSALDELTSFMKESDRGYSDHTVLLFGSVLGEAFGMIFGGRWVFSHKQDRWVVVCQGKDGADVEMNVFHKIEKRIDNGMEDSIEQYYQGVCASLGI